MKQLFEAFAREMEDTIFTSDDRKVPGIRFSTLPVTNYLLEIMYKGNCIRAKYSLGLQNLGHVELKIKEKLLPDFEVRGTNHLANLFLRRKQLLKVNCDDINFKKYLEKKLMESNLEQIAKDNIFEPEISSKAEMLSTEIMTSFHLEFSDKIGALKAVVQFYKDLIDYAN